MTLKKPITGLTIVRGAQALGISATQAERLVKNGDADFRMRWNELYGAVADRMATTDAYVADPDLIELDRVSAEIDAARQAHRRGKPQATAGVSRPIERKMPTERGMDDYDPPFECPRCKLPVPDQCRRAIGVRGEWFVAHYNEHHPHNH